MQTDLISAINNLTETLRLVLKKLDEGNELPLPTSDINLLDGELSNRVKNCLSANGFVYYSQLMAANKKHGGRRMYIKGFGDTCRRELTTYLQACGLEVPAIISVRYK